MEAFPDGISFCYDWRSYQAKALDQLDKHLKDKHFHLVAPPGSGKTVLGLEVMLRLNQPTFIVAPTIAIRNQWADRFQELFLQTKTRPDWISTDIRQPTFLTITTYQSLHSLYRGEQEKDEEEELDEPADSATDEEAESQNDVELATDHLHKIGFKTFILDEAHHLRTAWWQSTIDFRDSLGHPAIVALTATPPYDTSMSEWKKYVDLCGHIDAEISVPELVREAELCPHQDYIYASAPSHEEAEPIYAFKEKVRAFQKEIIHNDAFKALIEQHPWIASSKDHIENMLSSPSYFSSLIIYLKKSGSTAWKKAIKTIEANEKDIPDFDLEWLEELLTGVLFKDDYFAPREAIIKDIHKQLSQIGAVERRKVMLQSTDMINRTLVNSVSKLSSISQIVSFEEKELGKDLRLVILADYIRMKDMPNKTGDEKPLVRLGVIPIFEKVRRELGTQVKIGVLTGSIVIIPSSALPLLQTCADEQHLEFQSSPLAYDEAYIRVEMKAASRQKMVSVMTEVFSLGGIQVLVGTTALLGEGWDAPSINSLILASYVGTFMLSNQMRGRAIRTETGNPKKTANIWHLVCFDPDQRDGGHDFNSLTRRFRSLIGIAVQRETIETGIERMNLQPPPYSQDKIHTANKKMFERASNRKELFDRWKEAVEQDGEITEEIISDKRAVPRPFIFRNTLKAMFIFAIINGVQLFFGALESSRAYDEDDINIGFLIGMGIIAILSALPLLKAIKTSFRHSSIESSMVQVGEVVYNTLHHMDLIQTNLEHNQIHAEKNELGFVTCWMEKGSTHEKTVFLKAMEELVDPIENPRYILLRKSRLFFIPRYDYHAIPQEIGRRKENAEFFTKEWEKRVGKAELIYTRTPEGRNKLLTARMKSMSAAFVPKSERISAWR
ncbi:DEAD/DEAH box helicase family protein [Halobacillus hunanensis]|uniref:DEAD/DEAH box helicase family protein n=1 Tax=Halobacillus hunanensis TaxID=578214 RepID=UPI0009A8ACF1|nr:DEAD/DEAH box helicase family protein [Halobacillus hunanensis]